MRKGGPNSKLRLAVPAQEVSLDKFLTQSGTFKDGDLLVNKDGVRIVQHTEQGEAPLIKPSDNQLTLADMDIVKVIGKGNGGLVQLVRHKWTGQFFALKVIQMNIQESMRKQIAQELKINQSSQCPFVVVCYQCSYDNGVISIVLEYMDGGSLADFLKKVKSIPEPYLAAICKQVLKGLIYLHHEKHIIHRDLKPSNILINHRGEVKISDFGVSAILASSSGQQDTFIGTYNYMSPERISGSKHGYISDIWSLGLVMLECATGHFPYPPVESFFELLEAVVDKPAPSAPPDQFSEEFCSFISAWSDIDHKDDGHLVLRLSTAHNSSPKWSNPFTGIRASALHTRTGDTSLVVKAAQPSRQSGLQRFLSKSNDWGSWLGIHKTFDRANRKKQKDRKSAQALLRHPFLTMYEDLNVDLASYFTEAGSPLATF